MKLTLSPKISTSRNFSNKNTNPLSKSTKIFKSFPLLNSLSLKTPTNIIFGFSSLDAQSVYRAKCRDLNIISSKDQEQKFIVNFLNAVQGRTIDLNGSGLGKYSARVIADVLIRNSNYSRVILSNNNLADDGCEEIARMLRSNLSIIHLDISGNNLTPEGAARFFKKLIRNQGLISLDISSQDRMSKNRIGAKGSQVLCNYLYQTFTLMFLNLCGSGISKEGLESLSLGLSYNSSLLVLNLSYNNLEGRSIQVLFSILGKSKLKELILSGNPQISKGSEFICNFLLGKYEGGCHLSKLDLSKCEFDDESSEKILFGLETNLSVIDLNLAGNPLGYKSGEYIGRCFEKNSMLRSVNLSSCNLTEEGVLRMNFGLIRNFTIKSLSLSYNYLCDNGAKALSEALKKNSGVQVLDISNNLIKNPGGYAIIESLYRNSTLKSINLNYNSLKDEIGHDILAVVSRCKNIISFSLELNSVDLKYVNIINKCLKKNSQALKSNLSPKIQNEIEKLIISDEHIETVFNQISLKEKEKEDAHKKFFKQRTKFFDAKNEETEKYEVIKEERVSILNRKQSLTREHDITYFDVSKTKLQKEKEMREIKETISNVTHNVTVLKKRSKDYLGNMIFDVVFAKKQRFTGIVNELKNALGKVETERNKVRNELEEMKVTFQSLCEQLIAMRNLSSSVEKGLNGEKPKVPGSRKRTLVVAKIKK